ncbi:hypothetical protein JCM10908_003189 [Rhodotorula pacifica]|uniref:uncharacterized protein n=1 Tax=Rhodotorula pacifica TaxID=1495444 RepID=UPI00317712B6
MPNNRPEPGLDGWFVCGAAHDDLLFYSKRPVIQMADGRQINIESASRGHWTPLMHNAHRETLGIQANQATTFRPELPNIEQFALHLHLRRENHLAACYTTILNAIPYKVGEVDLTRKRYERQYVLPCDGKLASDGTIAGTVDGTIEIGGPRYLQARTFHKRGSHYEPEGYRWATTMAQNVFAAVKHRGWTAGPSESDPRVPNSFFGTGRKWTVRMWQLTPILDGIRWEITGQDHIPPKAVEWACKMTPLDANGKEEQQPEDRLTGFSATVLYYTLAWPPLDLERAVSPTLQALVPAGRLPDQQAHVFLPSAGQSAADTVRGSHRPLTYLPPPDSSTSRGQPGWRPFPSGFHAHPDPHLPH